jgi:hemerythrin superfamily protein
MEKSDKTTRSSSKSGSKRDKAGTSRASANGSASDDTSQARTRDKTDDTSDVKADAFDFLKGQHQEVKQLFSEFEDAEDENAALEVARVICQKLTVHATIEEEIFYPAARAKEALKDSVLEALEEHLSVKRLIADIEEADADDETLKAKVSVLEEQVSHHVKEEETELFPMARKAFSKEERRVMGQQLSERSEALEASDASAHDSVEDSSESEAEGEQEDESSPGHNGRHPPHSSIHSNH